jgi:hypothetical protein
MKLKLWETVRLSFALQQLRNYRFECVTSFLRELHFRLNNAFHFYETDFMQLVSPFITLLAVKRALTEAERMHGKAL